MLPLLAQSTMVVAIPLLTVNNSAFHTQFNYDYRTMIVITSSDYFPKA
jgi:hypothetical protein